MASPKLSDPDQRDALVYLRKLGARRRDLKARQMTLHVQLREAIVEARAAGVTVPAIMRATSLSRPGVYKLEAEAKKS